MKGLHIHILEAVYAAIGYNPAKNMTEFDTDQLFGESEETKRESQVDAVMNKYINPYATRLPANWQKVYLTTFFEIDCQIRLVMINAMRKVIQRQLKGKAAYDSDSGEGSDNDDFTNDISQHFSSKRKEEIHQNKCCSHDHGGHSHQNPQPPVSRNDGMNPYKGSPLNHSHQSGNAGTKLNPQELDQSTANLDTSVDL